jgi:hypothetical protein
MNRPAAQMAALRFVSRRPVSRDNVVARLGRTKRSLRVDAVRRPRRISTSAPTRRSLTLVAVLLVGMPLANGCQQKMADQPVYEPYEPSRFFADGQSARTLPAGVVARGHLDDDLLDLGRRDTDPSVAHPSRRSVPTLEHAEQYVDRFPMPLDLAAIQRGQQQFLVYCTPCHARSGNGQGTVVIHGFPAAASYHTDRLRDAPAGYLFEVITHGVGKMPAFANRLTPRQRWEVVSYVRALQLSQHAEWDQLPPVVRQQFERDSSGTDEQVKKAQARR